MAIMFCIPYYVDNLKNGLFFRNDWIEIRGGGNITSPVILNKTCGNIIPPPVLPNSDEIFLRFHSDDHSVYGKETGYKILIADTGKYYHFY